MPYYKRSCTCDDLTAPLASDCCGGIRVADGYFSTLGWSPLDAALGLPAGENSYVLEDWLERLCVKEAYGESVADLRAWLGTTVSVRTAEGINRHLADYSEGFRLNQGTPAPQEDEEILVVSADGKGVPMRRPLEQRLREATGAARELPPYRQRMDSGEA